jgi:glycosyltransferase involved in cell wall biosynthesis
MVTPVPDKIGAAVEGLIQVIVEENEKRKLLDIDLYTVNADYLDAVHYSKTNLIRINPRPMRATVYRYLEKLKRVVFGGKFRLYNGVNNEAIHRVLQNPYDVIIVENNMFVGKELAKRIGDQTPIIYHAHNETGKNGGDKPPEHFIEMAWNLSHLMAVSEYIKNHYAKMSNVPSTVLYNGVSDHFDNKENYRKRFALTRNDVVVGFVGRISPEKGILELIKAFNSLDIPNTKLLIAGGRWRGFINSSSYSKSIEDEAAKNPRRVIFAGAIPHDDIHKLYNTIDIAVVPSKWEEPGSCAAIEALSMGKAIIASKSGGVPELLRDAAVFIPKDDASLVPALQKSLASLLTNKAKRQSLSKKARNSYISRKEFSRSQYYQNFCDIIINVVKKSS